MRAPVQYQGGALDQRRPQGTIDWAEHLEVWEGYKRKYPSSARAQGPEVIARRGGWGYWEGIEYLGHDYVTWEPRGVPSSS